MGAATRQRADDFPAHAIEYGGALNANRAFFVGGRNAGFGAEKAHQDDAVACRRN